MPLLVPSYFPLGFRPAFFFRAAFVRPSTPPLFHSVERQDLRGHSGGSSTSGIH